MIINFSNFGGGGGSSYVLSAATSDTLGGIMVGSGLSITSAGTLSVEGGDAEYAMALKSLGESGEQFRVVNEGGYLYYIEEIKEDEDAVFVKVYKNADSYNIYMAIDGQTDTDVVSIQNDDSSVEFTITIGENGDLYYFDGDQDVYYDTNEEQYTIGDFTFGWYDEGATIICPNSTTNPIEVIAQTDNYENYYLIAKEIVMANQDQLGLVKIGDGITLADDGTISVEGGGGGGIEVVSSLPASGTDGQLVNLVEQIPALVINITGTTNNDDNVAVTANGITHKTKMYNYEWFGHYYDVYVNADHSVDIYYRNGDTTTSFSSGTVNEEYVLDNSSMSNSLYLTVTDSGFTAIQDVAIAKENAHVAVNDDEKERQTLFKYSSIENPVVGFYLSSDLQYCEFRSSDITKYLENGDTLIWFYMRDNGLNRLIYNDGILYLTNSDGTPQEAGTLDVTVDCSHSVWFDLNMSKEGDLIKIWLTKDSYSNSHFLIDSTHPILEDSLYESGWTEYGLEVVMSGYTLYASKGCAGAVKVSGNDGLYMDNGYIKCNVSVATATTGSTGVVKPSSGLNIDNQGTLTTQVQAENVGNNTIKIWLGTQAEYDLIQNPDSYTVYIIKESQPIVE